MRRSSSPRRPSGREVAKAAKTQPAAPLTAAEAVQRANAWLDAARVMTADFVQVRPNGKRSEGQLTVARPGRMLFQYAAPAPFEIVADGRSVAVIDHKLNTQDEYFIAADAAEIHARRSHRPRARHPGHERRPGQEVRSRSRSRTRCALGGMAHLELIFDPVNFALKQWTVIDAQGFQTVVALLMSR